MRSAITCYSKYGKDFQRTFRVDLRKYLSPYYGFELFDFEKDFSLESEDRSMKDLVAERYSEDAARLLMDILDFFTEKKGILNKELEFDVSGEPREYQIESGGEGNFITVTGNVTWPFAVRKEGNRFTIDHLPTGCYIVNSLTTKKKDTIIKILTKNFSERLRSNTFDVETYIELFELIKDYR